MNRVTLRIGRPPQGRRRRVWGWPENATEIALNTLVGRFMISGGLT